MASSSLPLTTGGRIVAVAGVLFLLDTFAPWHRLCVVVLDVEACRTHDAWATTWSSVAALLVAVLLAELLVSQVAGLRLPGDWARFRLGIAALATALVILQVFVGDGALDRTYGVWFGLVLAAALTYGSYLRRTEAPVGRLSLNR
ncbi:hypothetical protein LWF15_04770 [Kineosporia rhizophila]|uniref:hypothetical protein n=1 Tax=Kineosporia rhizophila TaxID=84633 RepID=UPI000A8953D9|nr:hypothetical protein [Kineosporia rhizophila]MCE0534814.1 hypothetical protein [Kineosporia rhizophila]